MLAGLPDTVVTEVLYAVQTSLSEGRRVMVKDIRGAAQLLRRCGVAQRRRRRHRRRTRPGAMVPAVHRRPRRPGTIGPRNRTGKDIWDLRVFGAVGRLSFVGSTTHRGTASRPITQPWLKHAGPGVGGGRPGVHDRRAGAGRVAAVGLLSEHLGRRADAGRARRPSATRDIAAFLARLTHLERAGVLSAEMRARSLDGIDRFLSGLSGDGPDPPRHEAARCPTTS